MRRPAAVAAFLLVPAMGWGQPHRDWQGEWGARTTNAQGRHRGGSVTILDCAEDGTVCRVRLVAESDRSRCGAAPWHDATERALAAPGDPPGAADLLPALAGLYKRRFTNERVDGTTFASEDVLEIVPVTGDAFFRPAGRRRIRYLERLVLSPEYKEAVAGLRPPTR